MLSFIIPCYKSANTIKNVVNEVLDVVTTNDYNYEIILVNDYPYDNTIDVLLELANSNSSIKVLNLSRNFGQQAALMAGYNYANGDYIVCMDDDGQTPIDKLPMFLTKIDEGADVVFAKYPKKKHSLFRNIGSFINTKMAEVMISKPKDISISSLFVMRRFVLDDVIKYKGSYSYVIGLILRVTNNIVNVDVEHRDRFAGDSGYNFHKLVSLWLNGFTSFSVLPLRVASLLGIFSSFFGFIYSIYIIIKYFCENMIPGWSSLVALLLIIGGIIMMILGMIGEYVGRIYLCINSTPQYVIKDKKNIDI